MITLNRQGNGKGIDDTYTIGVLNTSNFKVFTLEDDYDQTKVYGHTRIPAGTYEIKLRTEGRFHEKYLKRFPGIHKGMLQIINVPNYEYILIHCGNTSDDTAGCVLVGMGFEGNRLNDSTTAYKHIYTDILNDLLSGQKVFIQIID
jgi:hypothetical protein